MVTWYGYQGMEALQAKCRKGGTARSSVRYVSNTGLSFWGKLCRLLNCQCQPIKPTESETETFWGHALQFVWFCRFDVLGHWNAPFQLKPCGFVAWYLVSPYIVRSTNGMERHGRHAPCVVSSWCAWPKRIFTQQPCLRLQYISRLTTVPFASKCDGNNRIQLHARLLGVRPSLEFWWSPCKWAAPLGVETKLLSAHAKLSHRMIKKCLFFLLIIWFRGVV